MTKNATTQALLTKSMIPRKFYSFVGGAAAAARVQKSVGLLTS